MYKYIIFDFDGTIADTLDAGLPIYNEMARKHGFKEIRNLEGLRSITLREFIKRHKISRLRFLFYLRELLKRLNKDMNIVKPYKGMDNVIKKLNKRYKLGIVSANSKENILKFLELNDLKYCFDFVYNYQLFLGKSQAFKKIIKGKKLSKDDIIYIGDEDSDIIAAKKAGIKIISVTWGMKNKNMLKNNEPDFIAEKPEDILLFLEKEKAL
ncbi:HAD-IA family hydrolase [Candidatus Woesearchaeota archaeon]|nr:HAD-IA family hydrolase [Candidatus Woesearchaeota archaeon]